MSGVGWAWWAGLGEERMTIGPCPTRDSVISEAIDDIGEGEGSFIVMEAVLAEITLSASSILDDAYNHWCDDSDLFSSDHDAPEPQGTKEEQGAAEADLQAILDAWIDRWRHTLPTPNMFANQHNMETIANDLGPEQSS